MPQIGRGYGNSSAEQSTLPAALYPQSVTGFAPSTKIKTDDFGVEPEIRSPLWVFSQATLGSGIGVCSGRRVWRDDYRSLHAIVPIYGSENLAGWTVRLVSVAIGYLVDSE